MPVAKRTPGQINWKTRQRCRPSPSNTRPPRPAKAIASWNKPMLDLGRLQNALILHRQSANGSHRRKWSPNLQNAHLTDLHRNDPAYNRYGRRLLESVAKRVNTSFSEYFKRPEYGRARTASPYQFNTLELSEPANRHLKLSESGKTGYVHVKGLPRLTFKVDGKDSPKTSSPRMIRITPTPRRFNVLLVFKMEKEAPKPVSNSVGIDPGRATHADCRGRPRTGPANPRIEGRPAPKSNAKIAPQDAAATELRPQGRPRSLRFTPQQKRQGQAALPLDRRPLQELPQRPWPSSEE